MEWWQILLLTLYSAWQILDSLTTGFAINRPVVAGMVAGLVMGDLATGLTIGASMQLVVLGVGTFGGASQVDATSGTVLATAFAVSAGMDPETAIGTIAVPVAALLVQMDILGRFATTFFAHRVDAAIERFDYKGIERNFLLGALPWALSRALPVFLALALGQGVVENLVTILTGDLAWVGNGLKLAGRMLPGVGFAILLRYLPVKKHLPYLILGFSLTALLKTLFDHAQTLGGAVSGLVPSVQGLVEEGAVADFTAKFNSLPMLAVALIGAAFALQHYKNISSAPQVVTTNVNEGEIEDDEF